MQAEIIAAFNTEDKKLPADLFTILLLNIGGVFCT